MFPWLLLWVACLDASAPLVPGDDTPMILEVPKGTTPQGLGKVLEEAGFPVAGTSWKLYVKQHPEDVSCLKAGKFEVRHEMSLKELTGVLCGPPLAEDVPFTVLEGWRIRDIDAALVEKGWIKPGEYAALANAKSVEAPFEVPSPTLEGYLYPETYMVRPQPFDVEGLIERQLKTFQDRFLSAHTAEVQARGLHDVVVMASMLEREEPKPDNRKIVAGILYKRLEHGWQLGVDATSRYELDDWNDRKAFLQHLRDPEDPYNTRIHKGLPPTPIGNPSLQSLEAALAPVESPYWFYLHDGSGEFHGGKDAAEHDRNRAKYGVY